MVKLTQTVGLVDGVLQKNKRTVVIDMKDFSSKTSQMVSVSHQTVFNVLMHRRYVDAR